MLATDYFKMGLKSDLYRHPDWIVSLFCLSEYDPQSGPGTPANVLKSDPTGYYFIDEQGKRVMIEDSLPGQPLLTYDRRLDLVAGEFPNVTQDLNTSCGNLLLNCILLIYPFGKKIGYWTKKFKISDIETIILDRFADDPTDGNYDDSLIYVSEYKKFAEATAMVGDLATTCVIAATAKNISPPDGLAQFKAELLKKYAGQLDNPVQIAAMIKELQAFDEAWRAGDEGNNFMTKKSLTARQNKFLTIGGVSGAGGASTDMQFVENSLYEGWGPKEFPALNTKLRLASYSRGAETMLGGVEVKWMIRASSNINITTDDCGSQLGIPILVTPEQVSRLKGFSVVTHQGSELMETTEKVGAYLGKKIMVRSPMYCNISRTDFCRTCLGTKLSNTPFAASSAVSAYGQSFLSLFLARAHGRSLETEVLDLQSDLI